MIKFAELEPLIEVVKGHKTGHSIVHKYGTGTLTTTMSVVTQTGAYQVPTTAQSLEFVSDSANDAAAGTGAREITVIGLNASWEEKTCVINTNGLTAVPIPIDLIRVYRWYVSKSGTYATSITASHAGNLTIRGAGGGTVWDTIPVAPLPYGQSVIGAYTIPKGKTGYVLSKIAFVDTAKTADIYLFRRDNADTVAAPYTGIMRIIEREIGVQGGFPVLPKTPKGPFKGPCDIGFFGVVSTGTADVSVEFEILLVDK